MYTINYSSTNNRIYVKVVGDISDEEMNKYEKEMLAIVDKTTPGFTVLADLLESNEVFIYKSGAFQSIRNYGIKKGFKASAHVLNNETYEANIGKSFEGIKNIFLSCEDAERFLDTV